MATDEFEIDFDGYARYVWLVAWMPWFGRWYMSRRREATRYWLEGSTLRVEEGVLFRRSRAIPVARISDVLLVQDPYMARCGRPPSGRALCTEGPRGGARPFAPGAG